jgi:hypothetical protein
MAARCAQSALHSFHSYLSTRLCPTSNFAIACYTCRQQMFDDGTGTVLAAADGHGAPFILRHARA